MKTYQKTLILTFVITLLPCLIGLLLWNQLPDRVPIHFNFQNEADRYSSKAFAVFGLPLFLAATQLLCTFAVLNDPKKKQINDKVIKLVLFIVPVCSVLVSALCLGTALGYSVNIGLSINLLMALLFVTIGNYMPKIKQNYTTGIKLPWTLSSESNWNKTHRLSGWLWIFSGILMFANIFMQKELLLFSAILICTIIPGGYSYLLYKKENTKEDENRNY